MRFYSSEGGAQARGWTPERVRNVHCVASAFIAKIMGVIKGHKFRS